MKKLVLALVLVSLLVAGCGKNNKPQKENAQNPQPEQNTATENQVVQESSKDNETNKEPAESPKNENTESSAAKQNTADEFISEEAVKKLVFTLIQGASEKDIREFKKEFDDGKWVYDIKIAHNGMEYDFEIDAKSGQILAWDSEAVND